MVGALRRVRAGAATRPDLRRRGARLLVQAGVRPALRRAHRRGQARRARGRGRGLRERDAAPRELERLERLELGERLGAPLPTVQIVDLRREAATRSPRRCSPSSAGSRSTAARRSCSSIGAASRPRSTAGPAASRAAAACDVSLTLHTDARLHCHHCGFSEASRRPVRHAGRRSSRGSAPAHNGSRPSSPAGAGARAIRWTRTRLRSVGALQEALERFAEADRAVLVGTQMVAKGHHFRASRSRPSSTPTPARAARLPRAEERTFQLVTQLAGRSGRDAPGKVIAKPNPTRLRFATRPATTSPASSPRSSSGGASSATRRSGT